MKRLSVISLFGGVLLFLGGCAGLSPGHGGDRAVPAGSGVVQAGQRLEREGFAVLDFRARRDEFGRVYVVGEVKNTGLAAQGLELQASLRDGDGRLLAVGHFCPASYTNIMPTEAWPFAYSFGKQEDAARAELRIVGTFRAMDVLDVAYVR